ncbi:uncharacterized protein LOC121390773 [Gigantopelta aegis]|uniref:uncharacterized protein LOC121390773 n=1 Tax=Gigantopelta aegis TaxID=1735272 RepID=UPI001B88D60E|nr:uncharacterized protein LOC121390773 [Gigantopelta aegis]
MDNIQTQRLLNIYQEMIKGSFGDIQVVCDDGSTTGNCLILGALSPYFQTSLTSDMTDSGTGVLHLHYMSLSTFQNILKMYFYNFNTAKLMEFDYMKQMCNIYLKESLVLTPENCLTWWRTLKIYNFFDLSKRAFSYLTDNIADFLNTQNVAELSKAELVEIISNDDLKCKKEDDILSISNGVD